MPGQNSLFGKLNLLRRKPSVINKYKGVSIFIRLMASPIGAQ